MNFYYTRPDMVTDDNDWLGTTLTKKHFSSLSKYKRSTGKTLDDRKDEIYIHLLNIILNTEHDGATENGKDYLEHIDDRTFRYIGCNLYIKLTEMGRGEKPPDGSELGRIISLTPEQSNVEARDRKLKRIGINKQKYNNLG